jgi:hypothetical protein
MIGQEESHKTLLSRHCYFPSLSSSFRSRRKIITRERRRRPLHRLSCWSSCCCRVVVDPLTPLPLAITMLSSIVAQRSLQCGRTIAFNTLKRQQQQQQQHNAPRTPRRFTATNTATAANNAASKSTKETLLNQNKQSIWQKLKERPIEYATVPCVAAFVGIMTNWMGVKMLFYPIDYWGTNSSLFPREELSPYGYFGWQGK